MEIEVAQGNVDRAEVVCCGTRTAWGTMLNLTAVMGLLGVFLALVPPQGPKTKGAYVVAFLVMSASSVFLTLRQAALSEKDRKESNSKLDAVHKDVRTGHKQLLPPSSDEMPILAFSPHLPDCLMIPDIGSSNYGVVWAISVGVIGRERPIREVSVQFVSAHPRAAVPGGTILLRHGNSATTFSLPRAADSLEPTAYVWVARAAVFETGQMGHSGNVGVSILTKPPAEEEGEFYPDTVFSPETMIRLRLTADGSVSEWRLAVSWNRESKGLNDLIRCSLERAS